MKEYEGENPVKYDIGVYGLGVMGSALARNLIRHGFSVAVYSKNDAEREKFSCEEDNWAIFDVLKDFIDSLKSPKRIFLMITAGKPVDSVMKDSIPFLSSGDVVMDGGNSYYKDTDRRCVELMKYGIHYLGIGVSGGEKGALNGPSMMVGGSREGWELVKGILRGIAAQYGKEPCCGYVGPGGAGHYVKMVHNGIEYAQLQLIADAWRLLKTCGLSHDEVTEVFKEWRTGDLESYLMDITVSVLNKRDAATGEPLIDYIEDVAEQKGTGSWTLHEAIERGVYTPTIFEAVSARNFSKKVMMREIGKKMLSGKERGLRNLSEELKHALLAGMICSYAQGIELMKQASDDFGWNIDLYKSVKLWRNGCIIRSKLLTDITDVLYQEPDAPNILLTEHFSTMLLELEAPWRTVCVEALKASVEAPAMLSTILYYDMMRAGQMPVNLIQGLRDCFGAHTYKRTDREGKFHTEWE